MSYQAIAEMAQDHDLAGRVQACAAQEVDSDPYQWTAANMLTVCADPGWAQAWESARAGDNPAPGRDPGVVTDGMILSAVQAHLGRG